MARHEKYYNQQGCSFTVNGQAIQDFFDGESIRFVPNGDRSSLTIGTDGATQNLATNRAGSFEVDLKETSVSNDYLKGLLAGQDLGNFLDINSTMIDGSGAAHSGTGGTIKSLAGVSTGGPAMGKRTWIFEYTSTEIDR